MFERFRNRVLSPSLRRGSGPAPAKRLIVEELEPWILMSADAVPAFAALDGPVTADSEVYELLEQPIATRVELVFIDARVAGDDAVLADLAARTTSGAQLEVVVIDSGRDGLEQIDEALAGRENIAALHIVSHGDDGTLQLGAGLLDAAALDARAAELSGWRGALTSDADILLYGCDIGAGAGGLALVQTLSGLTDADVAASDDATGFAALGGDWDLEVRTGVIEADVVFSDAFQQSWQETLAITTGTTTQTGVSGATSLTWSHTVASGTDRLLVVSLAVAGDTTGITGVTYGGQALTLLGSVARAGGGGVKTQLWYMVAPTQGTANVVITTAQSTDMAASATTFFGVDQTQPFGTPATATGGGTTISGATVSSAAGELVIDSVVVLNRPNLAPGAGQTQLSELGGAGGAFGSSTEPGAASVPMSWTASGSGSGPAEWALIAAPIQLAPNNVAPVLDTSRSPALASVTEDAGAPSGAVGTGIQFGLVDFVVPSGQVDNVSDADGGAVTGVAVVGADTTNGTWWYSTNNGGSWLALGAVSNTNARLLAADGSTRLYFQPNANFNGSIANAITFRAWDRTFGVNGGTANASINGGSTSFSTATDTATITVTAVNDPPTTTPVALAAIAEDSGPRLITQAQLLVNAGDVDGDALTASALAISSGGGTLVNNGDGTWSYTPAANDSSGVSFSYTISDGNGGSVGGSATLDITPVNDAPTTTPVTFAPIAEDSGPRLITQAQLLVNAGDVDGDALTASALAISSGGGTLVNNGDGTWSYTPAANDNSSVSFSYTISDGNGGSVAGSATLDITPVNDPPTTTPVTLAPIGEDSGPRLITQAELLANAGDVDGDALTASALAISSGSGTLVNNGNGTWSYTPAANDSSGVSFSYTISDGNGGTVAGSATLDITPVNDPPTTTPVTLAPIAEDSGPRLITQAELLANAGDVDGDALTASALAISSGSGTLVNNGDGTWSYTPAANDNSSVSFSYTISDGNGGSVGGTASLDITPVNDAPTTTPVTLAPIAEDSGWRLITQAQLLVNAADVDGDALTASALAISSGGGTLVNNGDGTWSYTPPANDSSGVTFSYTISDGNGGSVGGSATLDITPVNDAPTTTPVTLAPIAEDGGPRLITQAQLLVNATDVDGDALTASGLAISSGSGTLVNNGDGTWSYTPAANDSSSVSFSYTIGDGNGGSVGGSATLDITPVNDAPTTTPVTLAPIGEDSGARLITQAELLVNAGDVDGDSLTASGLAISSGSGALVDNGNGTWTFTPAANDASSVSFSYTINDGNGGTVAGSATLDLTPVNDAPTTSPVTLAPLAEEGGPRLITNADLIANAADIDGDALAASGLAIVSGSGTLVDSGNGTWTYTPAANDASSVSFGYMIDDGNGGTVAGSATLDLTPVNDAPTTSPVTLAPLAEDGGLRLITNAELIANASDLDGDALTAAGLVIVSGNGALVDNGNGTWSYTPSANDSSSVSFGYAINDGNGGVVAGSATLDLTPVNDAPTTTPVTLAPLAEDGGPRLITNAQLIASAADLDGDPLTATGLAIASGNGLLVDNGNGTWTYTSAPNDSTSVAFSYTIADGNGGTVAGTATLDLTPVNDAPTTAAVTLAPLAEDGAPRLITNAELVANAADVDGDPLTATGLAITSGNGALVDNGDGTWTYTPAPNDSTSVAFTYTIADGNGGTVAGSATLDLTPVNDAPTTSAVTLAPLAEDGGPRLITNAELVANAADVDGDPLTATGLAITSGNGALVDNGDGTWTYTPAPNDSTSVAFSYAIADGNGGTVAGSATLDLTPVNDAPTTSPVTLAPLAEDGGPRLITSAELVANASDIDGDALTASALAIVGGNGTLVDNGNGTWTYTPAPNDASSVTFGYTIADGNGGTVTGSATLDLTPVNDAPTTTPVALAPLAEDAGPRLITNAELIANATDADGDPLNAIGLAITSSNGTLVDNGDGTWSYTPAADDSSSVSFSYTIDDGNGGTVAGSATLDLLPANDTPTTSSVILVPMTEDGGPRLIVQAELLANATDPDGDPLVSTGLGLASGNGALVDNGDGTWSYTPAADYSGPVAFLYTIDDGNGGSVAGSAMLDVTPVNDAPIVTSNGGSANANMGVAENTAAVTVVTSVDVDGDIVQYSIIGGADAARFGIDTATGALTFLSPPNYEAPTDGGGDNVYEVIVRAADGQGGSTTQTLQIAVGGVDEAPTVGGDAFDITDNQFVIVTITRLLANDADPEGGALQIVSLTNPVSGTLEQDASGGWRYVPAPGFTGNDRFTYTVADAGGRTATAEVVVVVSPMTGGSGGAAPTTTPAATPSAAEIVASGPLVGAVAANALGGGPLEGLDATIVSDPVDVSGADASAVWTVEAEEPRPSDGDDAVADFAAEIERQRVYDARNWVPPDQVELEQIALDLDGNLLRLAMNMGLQDSSRSLAVFDETFQEMLDGVRRTDREVSEIAIGSGVAVGAGVIAWLLRGGALAASLLSVLPTWASFDPIPILARRHDDEQKPTPPEDSSEAAVTRVLRPDALPPRQVRS